MLVGWRCYGNHTVCLISKPYSVLDISKEQPDGQLQDVSAMEERKGLKSMIGQLSSW